MEQVKTVFGFEHWLGQLVDAGKRIEPDKYTDEYVQKMRNAWRNQPLTRLVQKAEERRAVANKLTLST